MAKNNYTDNIVKHEGTVFADGKLITNKWFDDFLRFHVNSRVLQLDCVLGTDEYDGKVDDWLMENTYLYDTVDTKYMDASNVVQDVFEGNNNPKKRWASDRNRACDPTGRSKFDYVKMLDGASYQDVLDGFDRNKRIWKRVDYIYALIVHRITGSASSYLPHDHGYRNTLVHNFYKSKGIIDMREVIRNFERQKIAMYTSAACQIPGFPKPSRVDLYGSDANQWKAGTLFLYHLAPQLAEAIDLKLTQAEEAGKKITHHEILNFMTDWNWSRKVNKFWFQYHLISVDLSDQFPHVVDPHSETHWGKSSSWAMDLLADTTENSKISKMEKIHLTSALMTEKVTELMGTDANGMPAHARHKWNESVACNYQKYFHRWIPECAGYAHLLTVHPTILTEVEAFSCDAPGPHWESQTFTEESKGEEQLTLFDLE
jgi:hypothetical protein